MADDFVWQQQGEQAQLVCGPWQARLDASRPAAGLRHVSYQGVPLGESTFLGVDLEVSDRAVIGECYQRGGDFIVRYPQTKTRPFAVEAYWRAGWFEYDGQSYPRIDLVVSVETSLLDSRPRLSAVSNLMLDAGALVYRGEGCMLARLGGAAGLQAAGFEYQDGVCYAEICHPGDSISMLIEVPGRETPGRETPGREAPDCGMRGEAQAALASRRPVRCLTRLFGQPLEKGVILRSRLRGLFIPWQRSEEIARAALAELAGSPPPLTA